MSSSGLSAAFTAVAAVRIGFHLGRGDVRASKAAMWIVVGTSVGTSLLTVAVLWPLRAQLCELVTSDSEVVPVASMLVAAAFVAAGLPQPSIGLVGTSHELARDPPHRPVAAGEHRHVGRPLRPGPHPFVMAPLNFLPNPLLTFLQARAERS